MLEQFAVPIVGLLHMFAILAAFFLGRMHERPKSQWEPGGILDFGWEAWRMPFLGVIIASAVVTVVIPLFMRGGFGGGRFGGGGFGGGGFGGGGFGGGGGFF